MTPEQLDQFAKLTLERLTVLECVTRALVSTHHEPHVLRERFDAMYSHQQVARAQTPSDATDVRRRLIGMLFGENS